MTELDNVNSALEHTDLDRDFPVCHVAYIDILGFTNKVLAIGNNEDRFREIAWLQKAIQLATRAVGTPPEIIGWEELFGKIQTSAFSDCLVLSIKQGSAQLTCLVDAVIDVCRVLVSRGALPRGGISTGRLHHQGNIMFGEGQIRSYHLEVGAAKYPRVILDPLTADYWDAAMAESMFQRNRSMIVRDIDGARMTDIFYKTKDDEENAAFYRYSVEVLQRMLDQPGADLDAWIKMVWMAERFNAAAIKRGHGTVKIPSRPAA